MERAQSSVDWHAIAQRELMSRLDGSEDGLTSDAASARLAEFGPNALEAEEGAGPLRLLLRQVHNPLIYLLIAAAVVSLMAGKTVDSAVIFGVVVLNTILGFFQEWRAEGALAALRKMSAPHARVRRDGEIVDVDAPHVVPGDVLVLETGDRVVADARLLRTEELQVDESALTGESKPVRKKPGAVEADAALADRSNMAWMSTNITGGRGEAVVVATGMDTEMGRIAHAVRGSEREQTPLQKRMHKLGMLLGGTGIVLAFAIFGLGLLRGYEYFEMLMFSVAVAVSAIPEGLPAVISVTLALGVRRMADHHAIIRRLPAVETLGSTTVICSDKTGTITQNQMTVQRLWASGRLFDVTGGGYAPEGEITPEGEDAPPEARQAAEPLLRIGVLANNARLRREEGRWLADGNPSEAGLLAVGVKAGLDRDELEQSQPRLDEVPFSSDRKYMATLHSSPEGTRIVLVKGAPDRLLNYCSHVLIDGERAELTDELRERIERVNQDLAGEALRVMAGAYREFDPDKEALEEADVEADLTLAGLWGMMDPPRAESTNAVADAKRAGIRPVMITGDHAATASAVAGMVGITEDSDVLDGAALDRMDESALAEAVTHTGVYARVSPAHKLRIMQALQGHGDVVAMTGDGVNDAPALKGADIGVAMGRAGTEVAKEAADMVLTDDNFATIINAVKEGRVIYDNLRGVIFFLLSANAGEITTLVAALMIGLDLPLLATMILWVNLVTAGACTIPLGIEPPHADVLTEKPRRPGQRVLNAVMLRRLALLTPLMAGGTLGLFAWRNHTIGLEYGRTMAFTAMVGFEWFQALNARSERMSAFRIGLLSNRWLLLGVGIAIGLQVLVVQTPLGRLLFDTRPLQLLDWLLIVLVASSIWIFDEILKRLGVHGRAK